MSDLGTGQIVTVFRNRLRPDAHGYPARADELDALARAMPGFVDAKTFTSPDGERLTVVTFADRATHDAWSRHEEHERAKGEGRADFYDEYAIQVCETIRAHRFTRRG